MKIELPDLTKIRNESAWHDRNDRAKAAKDARDGIWKQMDALMKHAQGEGRGLHASEQRQYDEAEGVMTELGDLASTWVDRSVLGGRAYGITELGADERYAEGMPLLRGQSFEGYARARDLISEEADDLDLGKFLRGAVTGQWDRNSEREQRALSEGTDSLGGFLVPTVLTAKIIDLVRNSARVLEAGASLVPMESRKVDVARWEGDPSMAWHSENAAISPSDATLGKVTLTAQALASLVQCSFELLEDGAEVEAKLREAFASQLALRVDLASLYGTGTAPEPRGVKNVAAVTKTIFGGGANGQTLNSATTGYDPLIDAVGRLEDANEQVTGIIYAGRTGRTLAKLKDSTGQPITVPPYIAGVPRLATKQIPTNLTVGTSTDTSDLFTADWRQLLIGVRTQLRIQVLRERYADFGQVGFLAWWRGDIQVARPAAFDVTTGIRP